MPQGERSLSNVRTSSRLGLRGRRPKVGARAGVKRAVAKGRAVWDAVMGDDIGASASSFAYHMIFAIPPLVILSVTITVVMTSGAR